MYQNQSLANYKDFSTLPSLKLSRIAPESKLPLPEKERPSTVSSKSHYF